VQFDAESWFEGALDHALAMDLKDARRGEPAHQCLPTFPQLENQMTNFTSDIDRAAAGYSPDRVDALVRRSANAGRADASRGCRKSPLRPGDHCRIGWRNRYDMPGRRPRWSSETSHNCKCRQVLRRCIMGIISAPRLATVSTSPRSTKSLRNQKFVDSPVEGAGFELSVPRPE